jgi:tetratricopeptide (TPR) repeat protein
VAIDKNKIIEAATKFVQKGQYDRAIKEYHKLVAADPKDARIQQKLGELYQKKSENQLAADCFLKVAEIHASDGFFLKAVAVYKQVLKLNPSLVEVNLKLAELHQQLGLMSDAMAQYQLVVNHFDRTGNTRASLDTLRKMVDLDPDNIASRIKLAELYAREQMNPEAIEEFRRAAEYLKRNNRVDDYVKVSERLVFLDPGDLALTRELAGIYLAKQDTKRALAKLQLCFKADPKDIETLTMLAQAFQDLGQVSKTVSVFKELARIYDELERVDDERATWKKIRELAPDDAEARARAEPARAAPSRVAQPSPAAWAPAPPQPAQPPRAVRGAPVPAARPSPEQIAKLLTETDVYVKYGLHDKALEHLQKVFAADPTSIDAHEKAAHLHGLTGHAQGACDSLVRAVRLCMGRGDLERARANVRKLCERDPSHPDVPEFLEAVGGLAPVEEVSEIEDDAIIMEASADDEVVAPAARDFSAQEGGPDAAGVARERSGTEDAALAAAAAVEEAELIAVTDQDEELIASTPGGGDDMAIHAALEEGDAVYVPGSEELADEPVQPIPGIDEVPFVPQVATASFSPRELPDMGVADEPLLAPAFRDPAMGDPAFGESYGAPSLDATPLGEALEDEDRDRRPTLRGGAPTLREAPEEIHQQATRIADVRSLFGQAPLTRAPVARVSPELAPAEPPLRPAFGSSAALPAFGAPAEPGAGADDRWVPVHRGPGPSFSGGLRTSAASAPPPAAVPEQVEAEPASDELDEAAFFLSQGELVEAREILEMVQLAYPSSERALVLFEQLEALERGSQAPGVDEFSRGGEPADSPTGLSTEGGFDLASELAKEDFGNLSLDGAPQDDFQYSVEDVFEEFKKGVQKVVRPEDVDTHYDLGIAYKEMGLIDDAIGEFEQASAAAAGRSKEVDCLTMIAMCQTSRAYYADAVAAFKRALGSPQTTAEQAKALHFEIGLVYESQGEPAEALRHLQRVEQADPKYRDVRRTIERLRAMPQETGEAKGPQGSAGRPNGAWPNGVAAPDEPAPKGPVDPTTRKARKVGYL